MFGRTRTNTSRSIYVRSSLAGIPCFQNSIRVGIWSGKPIFGPIWFIMDPIMGSHRWMRTENTWFVSFCINNGPITGHLSNWVVRSSSKGKKYFRWTVYFQVWPRCFSRHRPTALWTPHFFYDRPVFFSFWKILKIFEKRPRESVLIRTPIIWFIPWLIFRTSWKSSISPPTFKRKSVFTSRAIRNHKSSIKSHVQVRLFDLALTHYEIHFRKSIPVLSHQLWHSKKIIINEKKLSKGCIDWTWLNLGIWWKRAVTRLLRRGVVNLKPKWPLIFLSDRPLTSETKEIKNDSVIYVIAK